MRKKHYKTGNLLLSLTLSLCLLMGTALTVHAIDLPDVIIKAIEKRYPGSKITEKRKEKWKGQMVYEVEIITTSGFNYEVILSLSGEILDIEEEQ